MNFIPGIGICLMGIFLVTFVANVDALPVLDVVQMSILRSGFSLHQSCDGECILSFGPYEEAFEVFKKQYDIYYVTEAEENYRFVVFKANVKRMESHNALYHQGKHTYYQSINQFSDKTLDEYRAFNRLGQYARSSGLKTYHAGSDCNTYSPRKDSFDPDNVDWREQGAVTGVKDQGQCGSCWTFSTTGSVEGSYAINHGRLISLSEQQIVDCCELSYCSGCNGGLMDTAFSYIMQTGGLETEAEYGYTAQDGTCEFARSDVKVRVTGCSDVPCDEMTLKKAVAQTGPVSVAIDANHDSFMSYGGGVYYNADCSSTRLDHGVLVVGYGSQNGQDYWIVKNSWGESWGLNGYILMSRNQANNCGIASMASFPYTAKP